MFLYGASGHAKVIIDILQKNKINVNGLFDDNPEIKNLYNITCHGSFNPKILNNDKIIISIGDNIIRRSIAKKIAYEVTFGNAIDISCIISQNVKIGKGTVIMPNTVLNTETTIGKHVIINTSATIGHECVIEDFVHISPNATLCGNVKIGEGAHVGAGATIIPNIKIGKNVIIGAGSVVTKDIPDNYTAVGIPARKIKKNEF